VSARGLGDDGPMVLDVDGAVAAAHSGDQSVGAADSSPHFVRRELAADHNGLPGVHRGERLPLGLVSGSVYHEGVGALGDPSSNGLVLELDPSLE
jgi:hypothetical protein